MVETLQEAGNLAVLSHFAASVIDRNDGNYTAIVLTHIQGVLKRTPTKTVVYCKIFYDLQLKCILSQVMRREVLGFCVNRECPIEKKHVKKSP